jgi:uncharacterized membrane protein
VASFALAIAIIITGGILLTAYQTTNQWNPQTLYRLWTYQPQSHKTADMIINSFDDKSEYNYDYRYDGSIKTIYKSIHFNNINDDVLLLSLHMDPNSRKQQYDFSLYFNKNGNYLDRQKASAIYHGQDSMFIIINEQFPVREVRLDAGLTQDFVRFEKNTEFLNFKSAEINDSHYINFLQHKAKSRLILNGVMVLIATIAFASRKRIWEMGLTVKKDFLSLTKVFIIFGIVFGVVFTFILPIYQAPDETTHLGLISEELGYSSLAKEMFATTADMDTIRLISLSGEKVDKKAYFDGMKNRLEKNIVRDTLKINPQIIRHLPQDIGIEIGLALNLPSYWIIIFGRLTALAVYLLCGVLALKLIPIKKTLLTVIMLSPMMIQQAASLSYDSFLIGLCILFVSYILYLKIVKTIVEWKDFTALGLLIIAISVIKLPYALLSGLILIIPLEKVKLPFLIGKDRIYYKKLLFGVGSVFIVIAAWVASKISFGKLVYAFLITPGQSLKLLYKTISINGVSYANSLAGNFGWLDTPVPTWFVLFLFILLLLSAFVYEEDSQRVLKDKIIWNKWDRTVIGVVFLGITVLLFIFMIVWTFMVDYINMGKTIGEISTQLYQINIIEGIQGRYFLPIILLPLVTAGNKISSGQRDYLLIQSSGIIVIILYTTFVLLNRYWIV